MIKMQLLVYPNTLSDRAHELHKNSGIKKDYLIKLLNDPCVEELLKCLEAEEISFKDLLPESDDKVRCLFEKLFTGYRNIVTAFSLFSPKTDDFSLMLRDELLGTEDSKKAKRFYNFIHNKEENDRRSSIILEIRKQLDFFLISLDSYFIIGKDKKESVLLAHLAASPFLYENEEGAEFFGSLIMAIHRARLATR